jgi:cell wall-associated NlpC family hydrolase
MKWLLAITMTMLLVGCTASSSRAGQLANDGTTRSVETQTLVAPTTGKVKLAPAFMEQVAQISLAKLARQQELKDNASKIKTVIAELRNRVGRTPYVFSGSTIYGWDCSGMVRWAYEKLGVEVPHSATKQASVGQKVDVPKVGDIVVFGWAGRKDYFHSAIYIGNGKVVNANRGFGGTHIQHISEFGAKRIVYVRILETM